MRTTRLSLVAASLVLLGGMTAACGEDDKDSDKKSDSNNSASPTPGPESEGTEEESPATPEESQPAADGELAAFCQAVVAAGQAESSGDYKKAQEAWDALHDIEPPADIPADAKEGFDFYHEVLTGSKDAETAKKAFDANPDAKKNLQAFSGWIGPKCADALGGQQ
ncbi:hypothetical protein BJ980_002429 [Nocardioides daedukensis]|uniref:Lipoprotein n=1 Tax=Nocardioides daedukensis TaxID=634462 RepID=A0A7Y9S1J8_9ACTN|nr:hypothetical protein [Nocardioides daedukensis]NYG59506.1 hypothetical protein [Nocardioides daedukensis]